MNSCVSVMLSDLQYLTVTDGWLWDELLTNNVSVFYCAVNLIHSYNCLISCNHFLENATFQANGKFSISHSFFFCIVYFTFFICGLKES